MLTKIKWGVIGSGGIARRRTIPEGIMAATNAELVAVYDVDSKINAEVAEQYGTTAANSLEQLLASDLEALYIATPVCVHYQQVLACAKAKKHVLCEKPLGMTVRQVKNMIEACRKARVVLGTAFMMRFSSQHQAALQLIKEGAVGKLVYARAQLSCWYPLIKGAWRQNPEQGGGGALIDMGGHCIDLLEMFFGPIASVCCFTKNRIHKYKSEDSAVAMLSFKNGALGTVDTFFCIPNDGSKNALELYGSKGSILAKGTLGQSAEGEMIAYMEKSAKNEDARQTRDAAGGVKLKPQPVNTYRAEIEEFSQAIITKRKPINNASIGLQSQKVLAACYKSAKSGRVIPL